LPHFARTVAGIAGAPVARMKNIKFDKTLRLNAETLHHLSNQQLANVGGGSTGALCPETLAPRCPLYSRACEY
jgi:hypothetical protein